MEKVNRFHRKGIRSRKIRLPALGALGRISSAGLDRAVENMAQSVAPTVQTSPAAVAPRHSPQWICNCRFGSVYMTP